MSEQVLPPAQRETSDVGFKPMLIAGLLMLATVGVVAAFVTWLYPRATYDKQLGQSWPKFAEPTLQPDTTLDMQHFHAEEMKALNGIGWVDQAHGLAHIPIADAMRDVAQTGIPDWPTKPRRPER